MDSLNVLLFSVILKKLNYFVFSRPEVIYAHSFISIYCFNFLIRHDLYLEFYFILYSILYVHSWGNYLKSKVLINLFLIFGLRWVFVAVCGLPLVGRAGATLHCGAWASHCSGFSCWGAWALCVWASVVAAHGRVGFSSCSTRAQ